MPTRIRIGATVQTTSISVLWLVFDGTGLRRALKRTITMTSSARTKSMIASTTISSPSLKLWIIPMIGEPAGCRLISHGCGWVASAGPAMPQQGQTGEHRAAP